MRQLFWGDLKNHFPLQMRGVQAALDVLLAHQMFPLCGPHPGSILQLRFKVKVVSSWEGEIRAVPHTVCLVGETEMKLGDQGVGGVRAQNKPVTFSFGFLPQRPLLWRHEKQLEGRWGN